MDYTMDYTFVSTAHDQLEYIQNTLANWTQNMFEEDDDLRVACDGLRTKCQAISTTLDGLLSGGDDDEDSEGDDSDEGSSDNILSEIQREANSRVDMILNSPREEKIFVVEFLNCMTMQKPGSRRKQEDLALIRLHRGYSDSDTNGWRAALQPYTMDNESYQGMVDIVCSFRTENLDARLKARDKYLASAQLNVGGYCFIHGFLKQIEAICFASDWRKKGREHGGKKFKSNFGRTVYQSHTGIIPPDPQTSSRGEKKAFNTFKLTQRRSITSRNYLLDMYQSYGASVLLDPTWDIDRLSHCSRSFPLVLKMLRASKPASLSLLLTPDNNILTNTIEVLGRRACSEQLVRLRREVL